MIIYQVSHWTHHNGDVHTKRCINGYDTLEKAIEKLNNTYLQVKTSDTKWCGGYVSTNYSEKMLYLITADGIIKRRGMFDMLWRTKGVKNDKRRA